MKKITVLIIGLVVIDIALILAFALSCASEKPKQLRKPVEKTKTFKAKDQNLIKI